MAIIPHVRAGLMSQLPKKQHMLLNDLDQIRKEYNDHNEKVLNKFVSIIGGIVEHSLARTIPNTDFDERAKAALNNNNSETGGGCEILCCVFLDGVATNIRKMHQVLFSLLPPDHLIDTFSRIFAFVDTKVPALFIAAANIQPVFQQQSNSSSNSNNSSPDSKGVRKGQPTFVFPKTNEGKRQFLLEIEAMTKILNGLDGVRPWDFAAINVMERQLEYSMNQSPPHDVDTDSNPASETISISDDVLSTSGDGENTNMVSTDTIEINTANKEDTSSTIMQTPSSTTTVAVDTDSTESVPVPSVDADATPISVESSCSELQQDRIDVTVDIAAETDIPATATTTMEDAAAAADDAIIVTSTTEPPPLMLPLSDITTTTTAIITSEAPPAAATSTTNVTLIKEEEEETEPNIIPAISEEDDHNS